MGLTASNKAKFEESVTPRGYALKGNERCFFTISVGTHNQSVEEIAAAYSWAKSKYVISQLLIGDSLYKITLQIREGLTQVDAEKKAFEAAGMLIEDFGHFTNEKQKISIRKTSDIMQSYEFKSSYVEVERFYEENEEFKNAVDADARKYIDRQIAKKNLKVDPGEGLDLSIMYLKQEIAVYLLLAEQGWLVDLYLGQEIPTLAKIMEGRLPAAPDALKRRVNIGLRRKVLGNEFAQKDGSRLGFWRSALKRLRKLI